MGLSPRRLGEKCHLWGPAQREVMKGAVLPVLPGHPSPPLLCYGLGRWTVSLFSYEFEKKVK